MNWSSAGGDGPVVGRYLVPLLVLGLDSVVTSARRTVTWSALKVSLRVSRVVLILRVLGVTLGHSMVPYSYSSTWLM